MYINKQTTSPHLSYKEAVGAERLCSHPTAAFYHERPWRNSASPSAPSRLPHSPPDQPMHRTLPFDLRTFLLSQLPPRRYTSLCPCRLPAKTTLSIRQPTCSYPIFTKAPGSFSPHGPSQPRTWSSPTPTEMSTYTSCKSLQTRCLAPRSTRERPVPPR